MPACPGPTAAPLAAPWLCLAAGSADGLAVAGGGVIPCAAVVSRVRKLLIWPIALIIGDGNITMVFFSTRARPASASSAVARAGGAPPSCPTHPKDGRGHRFALGGNKFGALLLLGHGLPGRRAFHSAWLSFSSTKFTHFRPRSRVATSRIFWMLTLMTSVSESASSWVC